MIEDIVVKTETLKALLAEMESRGLESTTLHEIHTFTMATRQTLRAVDLCPECHKPMRLFCSNLDCVNFRG
jgi:hypothetical protein